MEREPTVFVFGEEVGDYQGSRPDPGPPGALHATQPSVH